MRRSGAAPSRSRALRHPKVFQDESDTREPRAMRAVGAQRRTLHGAVTSAYDFGRDGRSNRTLQLPQNQRPIARSVLEILRDNRAPHERLIQQRHAGRERPRRPGSGATVAARYRGRSRPAYPSTICARTCRTAHGAVRSLGDRSRKLRHFSVLAAARAQQPVPVPARVGATTSISRETTSKF